MNTQTALNIKWYEVKKAVQRANERQVDHIVVEPERIFASERGADLWTSRICYRMSMDDFNWAANVLFATESEQKVPYTRDEVAELLDRVVSPRGGYVPARFEADLKERQGTLMLVKNCVIELLYDDGDHPTFPGGMIGSTTFLDAEEATAVFGKTTIKAVMDGAYKRASYLTFR